MKIKFLEERKIKSNDTWTNLNRNEAVVKILNINLDGKDGFFYILDRNRNESILNVNFWLIILVLGHFIPDLFFKKKFSFIISKKKTDSDIKKILNFS